MKDRYLFRGKRLDNGEWLEGNLYCTGEHGYISDKYADMVEIEPSTICQCTGLRDKTGKLIWENDICDRKEQYPEIVKYHEGDWTLDYSYSNNEASGFEYCNLGFYTEERKCVEVIGNIFDNPELFQKDIKMEELTC